MRGDAEALREPARKLRLDGVALAVFKGDCRNLARTVFLHGKREASGGILSTGKNNDSFHFFLASAGLTGVVLTSSTIFCVTSGFAFR